MEFQRKTVNVDPFDAPSLQGEIAKPQPSNCILAAQSAIQSWLALSGGIARLQRQQTDGWSYACRDLHAEDGRAPTFPSGPTSPGLFAGFAD